MTTLCPAVDAKSGKVRRVYVKRPGLSVKLWIEESRLHKGLCEVRFEGNEADFVESRASGEAAHIAEARAALAELGLDMTTCSWNEIVAEATAPASKGRSLKRVIFRFLPFLRRRSG
jgi:hypothetical protein